MTVPMETTTFRLPLPFKIISITIVPVLKTHDAEVTTNPLYLFIRY